MLVIYYYNQGTVCVYSPFSNFVFTIFEFVSPYNVLVNVPTRFFKNCPSTFDETMMFTGDPVKSAGLMVTVKNIYIIWCSLTIIERAVEHDMKNYQAEVCRYQPKLKAEANNDKLKLVSFSYHVKRGGGGDYLRRGGGRLNGENTVIIIFS